MDQQQPQWTPPPQQPMGWGGPGYGGPPPRPLGVTLSGVLFFIVGIIAILAAILALAGGALLTQIFGSSAAALGIILGGIVALIAILFLLTGWGLMGGKGWARILGFVLAGLGVLGGLSALTGNGLVYGVVQIVLWGGVIYALWMAGPYFSVRR
jgi:hypothetical protein